MAGLVRPSFKIGKGRLRCDVKICKGDSFFNCSFRGKEEPCRKQDGDKLEQVSVDGCNKLYIVVGLRLAYVVA